MDITCFDYDHTKHKTSFSGMLKSSINYLFEFHEVDCEHSDIDITWDINAAHYLCSKHSELDNNDKAMFYLNYINNHHHTNDNSIKISSLKKNNDIKSEMIVEIINDDNQLRFDYLNDEGIKNDATNKINSALLILKKNCPFAYNEIITYIDEIYLTSKKDDCEQFMRSGTNFYMWGLIMLYANRVNTDIYYVEHLIHECGHTALNVIHAEDKLVTNDPQQTYSAPLRFDSRPMVGLYHAFFILSRICDAFSNIQRLGYVSAQQLEEVGTRYTIAKEKMFETHNIILNNAEFTAKGKEIFNQISTKWDLETSC
ncbi:hypothetical protein CTM97_21350 [Photobacterium phosphoreum]|uniref:HEXXH motif domain-containing protein n=1 Tax=Photobacterium phosphoreum TaxID=659 RepID=A0A2T3JAE8_PHOPO|nr:HEXXH motif-containing putative peptide modification protein [Photobacterium phosphoreum]PSU18413.1 hypothetical protein CTM96_21555 [Photobacterium phosphoreum]PSU36727.1 hypothetical protein CTM97_21350 [Photobacterium phosphoreum]PSU45816.1 hypothetical protein C9J18_21465 [Photobacterium phosphoreum]